MTVSEQPQAALHVVELQVENVKKLRAVRVRPDGALVVVAGRNGQGKSSLLDAIEMALGGAGSIPAEPVRRGARKGRVVANLGELVVERSFSAAGGSELVVRDANGARQTSPQKLLDSLCARVSFDPLAFSRAEPQKQAATLRALATLDFSALDADYARCYSERAERNRAAREIEARLGPIDSDAPAEEVSVAELASEMERRLKIAQQNEHARRLAQDAKVKFDTAKARVARVRSELETAEAQLLVAERENAGASERAANLVDPDQDELRQRLSTAESHNRRARARRQREQQSAKLQTILDETAALTRRIEDIEEQKRIAIEQAQFPVSGLGFVGDTPTLHGLPLAQASHAEQLQVSVAIGAALAPRVKVMLVREGSLLDADSMKLLAELAAATGSQVWVERVGGDSSAAVVIENGEAQVPNG